ILRNERAISTGLDPVLYAHLARRSTGLPCSLLPLGLVGVDRRVKLRVVVHLHLAIELEAPLAAEGFFPERIQAGGEIAALLFEEREPGAISLAVGRGGGGAAGVPG